MREKFEIFYQKHKRSLIITLVALELVLGVVAMSMNTVKVSATFGVPINADCVIHNVTLEGLNDVDGNAVWWNDTTSTTFQVPTGDVITGVNITVFTATTLIDAYNRVTCELRILDPSDVELVNETVKSVNWVKTGYTDGGIYVTYLEMSGLNIMLQDVGNYQVLIVLYYLEG